MRRAAAAILATGCSTMTPADDPVALRVTDMEARLIRIERIVENQSLVQLASELETLRSETTALSNSTDTDRRRRSTSAPAMPGSRRHSRSSSHTQDAQWIDGTENVARTIVPRV